MDGGVLMVPWWLALGSRRPRCGERSVVVVGGVVFLRVVLWLLGHTWLSRSLATQTPKLLLAMGGLMYWGMCWALNGRGIRSLVAAVGMAVPPWVYGTVIVAALLARYGGFADANPMEEIAGLTSCGWGCQLQWRWPFHWWCWP